MDTISALIIGDRCPTKQEEFTNDIIINVINDNFEGYKHDIHKSYEGCVYHISEIHNKVLRFITPCYSTGK